MSVWYSLYGSIKVKACPEAMSIAERFCAQGGKELFAIYDDCGDGTALIEFEGGIHCSRNLAGELAGIAEELGEYAVTP
jgi:hypothetical protein